MSIEEAKEIFEKFQKAMADGTWIYMSGEDAEKCKEAIHILEFEELKATENRFFE